jgi:hypothetical protein
MLMDDGFYFSAPASSPDAEERHDREKSYQQCVGAANHITSLGTIFGPVLAFSLFAELFLLW